MQKIKAVIFDIDGTLVDRREAFLRMCHYLMDTYSERFPFQGTKEEVINHLVEIDANGYGGIENIIPKLKKLWELPHSVEEFIEERNEIFGKLTVPVPNMKEVLTVLKEKYKLGVITNGYSTVQRDKIITVGIEHFFEDIIVSGETEFAKPDPEIFALSCEHLGVKPEEAVYVGDYYPNDIAGALGANIKPIWISEDPEEHTEYSGIRVKSLIEILEYL